MARPFGAWLIDGKGLASKVKNAMLPATCQIRDCGAKRECPNCHHIIDNSDASYEWPGFPFGVKFEPSDAGMIEHLAAKCGVGNAKPHKLIDVFIPTLDGDNGIYYTHPENLPGAKKDGSSVYFFYRTVNAYATGQRKRRKIQTSEGSSTSEQVRWHKTGKTKPLIENGIQIGCKKIMVLYRGSKGGCKPEKSNWVMHQYHLGSDEEEKGGEYVVSRIFYQKNKHNEDSGTPVKNEETDASRNSPRTPKTVAYEPPHAVDTPSIEEGAFANAALGASSSDTHLKDELDYTILLEESKAPALKDIEDFLFCDENVNSSQIPNHAVPQNGFNLTGLPASTNAVPQGVSDPSSSGLAELESLELGSQPDFLLSELCFDSQDSFCSWL